MEVKNRFFWIAAIAGLILDQLSKLWVVNNFELTVPPQTVPLWQGVFHFTYVTNKGAAFSLFSENGDWLRWLSLAVSLGLIALGLWVSFSNRWEELGYGFILSGALGNGIDRLLAGEVVDFLDFRLIRFPIFNLADVFINVGIGCLLIAAFRPDRRQPADEVSSEQTRR
ncbi:MAG: lipoprotein signal peptidase [Leptolyngbyaceae cyanobacterium SM1_1_3]|nr:lipoprotein signal peptidase [Leptolyngbyaceae cyanobacterium SM1_1_3]NJM84827.1 lipoprotein signal peptidase [Leptolyngbyaceae cyanobacterium RM2_2_21]NJN04796.1 lipoprotein signal peptidase [Leptolyngbyaceae cyanobacterium RM1_1_2]NJO09022.1 lipoprotein signal peptidase [Leptolyngbyaceae cyanobacterium SL_1_1]